MSQAKSKKKSRIFSSTRRTRNRNYNLCQEALLSSPELLLTGAIKTHLKIRTYVDRIGPSANFSLF